MKCSWGWKPDSNVVFSMPLTINLVDIPPEGQSVVGDLSPSEMALSSDDGTILEPLHCVGQVLVPDDGLAHFQGTLTGKVARECVRCLGIFEEEIHLECEADFSQPRPAAPSLDSPKKSKKTSRRHMAILDETEDQDIDMYPITESQIDLLPALREHLILATPPHPVCQERCAGLCQACGGNLNDDVCECHLPVAASSSLDSDSPFKLDKQILDPSRKLEQIRV